MTGAIVGQWLSVRRSALAHVTTGDDSTWRRDVPMAFLPRPGDEVALWPDEDGDPALGPRWPVQAPAWGSDGVAWLELMPMRVDPDDAAVQAMQSLGFRSERPWWTGNDGDVTEARLSAGGWVRQ